MYTGDGEVLFKEFATAMIGKVQQTVSVSAPSEQVPPHGHNQEEGVTNGDSVMPEVRAKKLVFEFFDCDHSGVIDQEVCVHVLVAC